MWIETRHSLPASVAEARAWMERPGALVRLTPPGLGGPEDPRSRGTESERRFAVRLGAALLPALLRPR